MGKLSPDQKNMVYYIFTQEIVYGSHKWCEINMNISASKILCKGLNNTCVIILGSMNRGNLRTANSDRDVNALAGVRFPPSRVNIPNEITITTTGILLSMKLFNCKFTKTGCLRWRKEATDSKVVNTKDHLKMKTSTSLTILKKQET